MCPRSAIILYPLLGCGLRSVTANVQIGSQGAYCHDQSSSIGSVLFLPWSLRPTWLAASCKKSALEYKAVRRHDVLVYVHIEEFRADHQCKVIASNSDKYLIALVIVWRIVRAIDINSDDVASLYSHVVERRSDSASSHAASISTGKRNKDSVEVWHAVGEYGEGVGHPWASGWR